MNCPHCGSQMQWLPDRGLWQCFDCGILIAEDKNYSGLENDFP